MRNLQSASLVLFLCGALLPLSSPAHIKGGEKSSPVTAASSLVADYQFRNNLNSAVSTAPALTSLGNNSFETVTVDDSARSALSFDQNNGLAISSAGLITNQAYTIVLLFSLARTDDYRRLLDFKNGTSNLGLFNYNGDLLFFAGQDYRSSETGIAPNVFVQVTLTRDAAGNVTGYINGVRQFSFADSSGAAIIDSGNTLRFFRDNQGKAAAGYVVRVRLYNVALSGSEIAALDRLPNRQQGCPSLSGFNPATSDPGASFAVNGTSLNGVTSVKFPNNLAAAFAVNDETQLAVTTPAGAVTGTLTVTKPGCSDVQTSAVLNVPNNSPPGLVADYRFQDGLSSDVGSPPALTSLGNNPFENTTVDGAARRALRFDQNNGVALFSTAGLISNQAYTVVTLLSLSETGDYRRILEFKNGTSRYGLFNYNRELLFVSGQDYRGGLQVFTPNAFSQVTLTRDAAGNVAGYVDGVRQFSFVDVDGRALIGGNSLRFFRDNIGAGKASSGYVARIRIYNYALSSNEVAALDRLPAPQLATVSAASFNGTALASEAIVAAFGAPLATSTQSATSLPLPTSLGGTTLRVKDAVGMERLAPLFFVAPTQVNYQIPPGTSPGTATVTLTSGDGKVSAGTVPITSVAPGLFSANSSGQDVAAALVLRVKGDGLQLYETMARYDAAQNRFVAVPIDLGPATDQVFLLLFGTGWRFRSSLSAVAVKIGGTDATVSYAGPQGDFVGLDQLNVQVPRSLAGRGEVGISLTVDGKTANAVSVTIK